MPLSDPRFPYNPQTPSSPKKRSLLHRLRLLNLTPAQLLKQYASGERDFRGVNLSAQILTGVDLEGIDLSEAILDTIDLEGTNLTGVNLSKADLTRANLRRADLIGANLRAANLQGANLRGADLSGADLSEAYLHEADLGGAILPDGSVVLTSEPSSLLSFCNNGLPRNKSS
ncbi:MAG TPA: pentapeptide repeat-containing protein [Cyanobacteria bacterium UBA11162]|nr:pentapeptide repeat-containing protein [Cyanobacteria bacterium UBA11162]